MELDDFREELLDAVQVRLPNEASKADRDFAFLCEVGGRLTQAEEFSDFISRVPAPRIASAGWMDMNLTNPTIRCDW